MAGGGGAEAPGARPAGARGRAAVRQGAGAPGSCRGGALARRGALGGGSGAGAPGAGRAAAHRSALGHRGSRPLVGAPRRQMSSKIFYSRSTIVAHL